MGRKKSASAEEIADVVGTRRERLISLLSSRDGPVAIKRDIALFQMQIKFLRALLTLVQHTPRQQLRKKLESMLAADIPSPIGLPKDHLSGLAQFLDGIVSTVETGAPPVNDLDHSYARTFLKHQLGKEMKIRRFKPEFEKAFAAIEDAKRMGKAITVADLTRQLTPFEYKKNPESAQRSMQRGVKRVEKAHKRCLHFGISSPFLKTSN